MKSVLIYGCGAVGLALAAALYDSNWSIDLKASGKTKEVISNQGIIRRGLFKEVIVPKEKLNIYENLEDIKGKSYDYVLICTKTTIDSSIAKELGDNKDILKQQGKIVLFQNGWGNDEPFIKYFNKNQIYSSTISIGFKRPERNISEVTVASASAFIGSLYGEAIESIEPLAKAINDSELPFKVTEDMGKAIWAKMLYNCTLNPLSAVLNVAYGKLIENENSIFIMNKIIEEIYAVMDAAGFSTHWKTPEDYKKLFYSELVPNTAKHRSSTLQDIERKIKTEIDSLNGSVVKLGKKYNVQVPYNTMIYNMIKAIESYF